MKKLTLIFNDVEEVHLGKDVFLTPYYISKIKKMKLDIVYPETKTNTNLKNEYKGVRFLKQKIYGDKKTKFYIREFNFFKYIFKNAKEIDLLMLFHFSKKTAWMCLIYKLLNPNGKVYVKLDMNKEGVESLRRLEKIKIRRIPRIILYKAFLKKTDLFSAETKEIYDELRIEILNIDIFQKLEYIPNGFDEQILIEKKIKIKNYKEKENIMLTVGRLGVDQKNNEMLLKALDKIDLKDWRIFLIGPSTEEFKEKYSKFIENNLDKKEKVKLIGNIVDKKELFEYYNRSKTFLLTSKWEGFPLIYPEALAFGNYILTTDVGGAKDITNNSKIGKIVPINDFSEFRKEIQKIVNRKIDLEKIYFESIEHYKNNFIWEKIIRNSKKIERL